MLISPQIKHCNIFAMRIKFKSSFLIALTVLFVSFSSCINDEDTRTYEDEMQELNELLLTLEAGGVDIDTTNLGVYYITHTPGEGELAVIGDTVAIEYEGFLTDGTMFDASSNWAPEGIWEFVYGEQSLIAGFNEAISYMNKNAEMEFIIPSELAYGAYGTGDIGAYQTLIFGTKLTDLKPTNP